MSGEPDFEAEALLDGLDDPRRREARLELLSELHAEGVSIDELRRAIAEHRLTILPVELALAGRPRYTIEEVARESGLDAEHLAGNWQALGQSRQPLDARVFTGADLESARRAARLRAAGVPRELQLTLLRVMGRAGAMVASAMREVVGEALTQPGDTERDLGRRFAEYNQAMGPDLGETMAYVVNLHVRQQLRDTDITQDELDSGRLSGITRDVAVSFSDLVGYTRMGATLPATELGQVAVRLAELAAGVANAPVTLIKTIGDAAMLVADDPADVLEATLRLVEAAEAEGDDFPPLKAGVAHGPAVHRTGDWYGHTVNLASRVTDAARPGSVLVTEPVQAALASSYRFSFAGEKRLKGIRASVKLFRARREGPDAS